MEFFDVIQKRYSVRSYLPKQVETEKLQQILEAARLAPTSCNLQGFKILVIKTANRREDLKKVYQRDWFCQAPYVLAVCSMPDQTYIRSDGKSFADVDAAIVMDHIILAATALGLGTCWVGAFDPKAFKEVFSLDDNVVPVALTPLGYPKGDRAGRRKKAVDELVLFIE
jgi:nitroreductase